jgi:hypothetical protein
MTSVCKCHSKIRYGSYVEKPNICFENQSGECTNVCSSLQPIFNEVGIPLTQESEPTKEPDTVGCDFIVNDPMTFAEQTVDRIIYSNKCVCKDASGSEIGSYGIRLQFPEECSEQLCKDEGFSQTAKALISSSVFSAVSDSGSGVTSAPVTQPSTTSPVTTSPVTTSPVTTSPVTTSPVTTSPVTTSPVTTDTSASTSGTSAPISEQKNLGIPGVSYDQAAGIWVGVLLALLILICGIGGWLIVRHHKQQTDTLMRAP